jgi:hypothetical protein
MRQPKAAGIPNKKNNSAEGESIEKVAPRRKRRKKELKKIEFISSIIKATAMMRNFFVIGN